MNELLFRYFYFFIMSFKHHTMTIPWADKLKTVPIFLAFAPSCNFSRIASGLLGKAKTNSTKMNYKIYANPGPPALIWNTARSCI